MKQTHQRKNGMKTSYEERMELITKFLKSNPIYEAVINTPQSDKDSIAKYYPKYNTKYDQACNLLYMCGFDCGDETIPLFVTLKSSEELCSCLINTVLSGYFKS